MIYIFDIRWGQCIPIHSIYSQIQYYSKNLHMYTHTYPGEGNGNPLQYLCLGNPMDRVAWWATIEEDEKSWTWLSNQTTKTHTYMCMYVCVYTHTYTYMCVYTYTHIHICVCMCVYTYTHIHICFIPTFKNFLNL